MKRPRVGLPGAKTIPDFAEAWRAGAERIDLRLRGFFPPVLDSGHIMNCLDEMNAEDDPALYTRMLSEPAWNLLRRGGKRWRPLLGFHLLGALGRDPDPFETLIAALGELTHTGSLIIDDIQDRSNARRGGDCLHLRYGDGPAINAANCLYFLPLLLIHRQNGLSASRKLEIHRIVARQFVRAHFGQARDLDVSASSGRDIRETLRGKGRTAGILRMYELKTGAPIAGLAEIAAVIAGAGPAVRRTCIEFGRAFGTAFQIVDDIRDFDRPAKGGRERGKDLAEGKVTYVILKALDRLPEAQRNELIEIIVSSDTRSDPAGRKRGLGLVRSSGALDVCRSEALALAAPGWKRLAEHLAPSGHKSFLEMLVKCLIDGAYPA